MYVNKNVKTEIINKVEETVEQLRSQINQKIQQLSDLKKTSTDPDIIKNIDDLIGKLQNAGKDLSVKTFGISEKGNILTSFHEHKHGFEEKSQEISNLGKEIRETKKEIKANKNSVSLMHKLETLQKKKGKMENKQVKIANSIIVQKLKDFKKSHDVLGHSFNQVNRRTEKLEQVEEKLNDKKEERKEVLDELKQRDFTNREERREARSDLKDLDRLDARIERLENKKSRKINSVNRAIMRDVKPSFKEKLKNAAQKLKRVCQGIGESLLAAYEYEEAVPAMTH